MTDKLDMLVEQFGGYVKAIVVNKIGSVASREDIEDCISDVFFEVCRSPETIPEVSEEIKYLLCTVAKRHAVDFFRRITYRSGNCAAANDEVFAVVPDKSDVESEVDKKALNAALWSAVKSLGEPDSAIIIYHYFYRKKIREIARLLSLSPAAVHKRCQRARGKIKDILLKQGYDKFN